MFAYFLELDIGDVSHEGAELYGRAFDDQGEVAWKRTSVCHQIALEIRDVFGSFKKKVKAQRTVTCLFIREYI